LSKAATEALKGLRSTGNEWLFPTAAGTTFTCQNFINRHWIPPLKYAGLPYVRFHLLRHTAATLLLQRNVNPKIVQQLLGHSSVAFTLDRYSHFMPGFGDAAADAMDDTLS